MPKPYKKCPRCHAPAPIEALECLQCGHRYRTKFVGLEPTEAFELPGTQQLGGPVAVTHRPFLVAGMWAMAVTGFALWWVVPVLGLLSNMGSVGAGVWLVTSRDKESRLSGYLGLAYQGIGMLLAALGIFPPRRS